MMMIQSHTHLTLASLFISLVGAACTPANPEVARPEAAKPELSTPKVVPAPPSRAPRPIRAEAPTDKLHLTRTTGSAAGPIPYTIVAPTADTPGLPIIIALHGRGDRAEGFCRLVERLRLPFRFVVGEAPMRWGLGSGKQWFEMKATDRSSQLRGRVSELGTLAAKRWPEAPPPTLLGFSQGAMLALQALAETPERFAGVIALSGALVETEGLVKSSTGRRVWLSAGSSDRTVPPESTQEAADALRALGHHTEVFRFDGGHAVSNEVVASVRETLLRWLSPPP
jgi:phospholipase/carboxylesterase